MDRTQDARVGTVLQEMLSAVLAGDLARRLAMTDKQGFHEMLSGAVNQLTDNMAEVLSADPAVNKTSLPALFGERRGAGRPWTGKAQARSSTAIATTASTE